VNPLTIALGVCFCFAAAFVILRGKKRNPLGDYYAGGAYVLIVLGVLLAVSPLID
jgi:4-hydroxybenzoate polyprenyltransferase